MYMDDRDLLPRMDKKTPLYIKVILALYGIYFMFFTIWMSYYTYQMYLVTNKSIGQFSNMQIILQNTSNVILRLCKSMGIDCS